MWMKKNSVEEIRLSMSMEVAEAKLDVHIWRGGLFKLILEGLFESKNFYEDRDK